MTPTKRIGAGVLMTLALVLVVASVAYACVPFKGQAQVNASGGGSPQNSGTHVGLTDTNDTTKSLLYCDSGTTVFPGWTNDTEAQVNGGGTITVSVSKKTGACAASLASGTNYSVIINNALVASASPFTFVSNGGGSSVWSIVPTTGCFTSATPNGNITLDTAFSVSSTGAGTRTYTLPSMNAVDGTNAASSVCIGRGVATGSPQAIFVPIKIEDTI